MTRFVCVFSMQVPVCSLLTSFCIVIIVYFLLAILTAVNLLKKLSCFFEKGQSFPTFDHYRNEPMELFFKISFCFKIYMTFPMQGLDSIQYAQVQKTTFGKLKRCASQIVRTYLFGMTFLCVPQEWSRWSLRTKKSEHSF